MFGPYLKELPGKSPLCDVGRSMLLGGGRVLGTTKDTLFTYYFEVRFFPRFTAYGPIVSWDDDTISIEVLEVNASKKTKMANKVGFVTGGLNPRAEYWVEVGPETSIGSLITCDTHALSCFSRCRLLDR